MFPSEAGFHEVVIGATIVAGCQLSVNSSHPFANGGERMGYPQIVVGYIKVHREYNGAKLSLPIDVLPTVIDRANELGTWRMTGSVWKPRITSDT